MTTDPTAFATEMTPLGEQVLVAGVRPLTDCNRLPARLAAPLQPRCRQKPLTIGLWDEDARHQLALF
jgi:hypothetical protein